MLKYHHCRSLESVKFDTVKPNPEFIEEPEFLPAYLWLQRQVGFYPLFIAVGETERNIRVSGYQNQFMRRIGGIFEDGKFKPMHRKKGEIQNDVLFSFEDLDGVFSDYDYWHIPLNSGDCSGITDYERRLVMKPSWKKSKWLRKAKRKPGTVQLTTPSLHLPDTKRVWVRNKPAKKLLEDMGFTRVEVKRLLVDRY